jgi:hypothetical protein
MLEQVDSLSNLDGKEHVDLYTSTDCGEVERIIESLGWITHGPHILGRELWRAEFIDHCGEIYFNPASGLSYETGEINLETAMRIGEVTNFVPMSIVRAYTKGTKVSEALGLLLGVLKDERQNVACIDSYESGVFVALSEFYK